EQAPLYEHVNQNQHYPLLHGVGAGEKLVDRLAVRRQRQKQLDDPGEMSGGNDMPALDADRRPAFDQTAVFYQNGIPHNHRQDGDMLGG
ncbi:MAG: hypothetical protein VXV97_13300, partial [Pseudomonadota bacterium]|nr:hypothetical protein [Pseudomonadota bacterium]